MPRNGSGTSSVINTFVIDTVADPDEVNANFTDVADQLTNSLPRDGQAGMNAPLPLQNGTNSLPAMTFTSDPDTGVYRSAANELSVAVGGNQRLIVNSGGSYIPKSSDIASAATTDLSTATGDYVNITGTTTITAFGTSLSRDCTDASVYRCPDAHTQRNVTHSSRWPQHHNRRWGRSDLSFRRVWKLALRLLSDQYSNRRPFSGPDDRLGGSGVDIRRVPKSKCVFLRPVQD